MSIQWNAVNIYLQPGITDMRKHINGLAAWVQEQMKQDTFGGSLFLFCSRDRKRLKILYWERNGFCLWVKRLEQDKFPWPQDQAAAFKIRPDELAMMLSGVDFFHAHQEIKYSHVA